MTIHYWTGYGTLCSLDNSRTQKPNHTDDAAKVDCANCQYILEHSRTCRTVQGALGRWLLVHSNLPWLAWSGSRWVTHIGGVPTGEAQVCNFQNEQQARDYARENNLGVIG